MDSNAELPAWMTEDETIDPPDFPPRTTPPPRSLHDLPIFGAFWAADAREENNR